MRSEKSYNVLSTLFKCIEGSLERLGDCSDIQKMDSTREVTEMLIGMLEELLVALAVITRQINYWHAEMGKSRCLF